MYGQFYAGKRILVTGVSGVKGTWLAAALLEAGAHVTGVDILSPEPASNFIAGGLADRIRFVQGDVNNLSLMQDLVAETDGVFHLAAMALVGDCKRQPLEAYRANALGAAAVLEALRLSPAPKYAVFVTTDKVYQPKSGELWVETDPLGASGAYAVSKACAELIIADYVRSYFAKSATRIAVARAGNVVIGGDLHSSSRTGGAGRIFVDCCEALAAGRPPEIFSPSFTRPYTYGLDILSGYMTLMTCLDTEGVAGEAFNFGPEERYGVSNAVLATKICELWGSGVMWRSGTPREEPFEYQSLSWDKSTRLLGWRPAYSLDQSLASTVRWYKERSALAGAVESGCLADLNRSLIREHAAARERLRD